MNQAKDDGHAESRNQIDWRCKPILRSWLRLRSDWPLRSCRGSLAAGRIPGADGADQGCGHHRRHSRQPVGGLRPGGWAARHRRQLADHLSRADPDLGPGTDGRHRAADRLQLGQQHAGQEHGRCLCRRHAAALQPSRLQDGHHRLLGRRRALARRRHPAHDSALRPRRADLRTGAGRAGAGRLYGCRRRQLEAGQPPHHRAHSRRRAGRAARSLRSQADAHGQRGAERRRFPHRRAHGRGHRPGPRLRTRPRRRQPPRRDSIRSWRGHGRACSTKSKKSRSMSIRAPASW